MLIVGLVLLVLLGLAWSMFISPSLEAYLDFKQQPKEPMFWCHKHGYFRHKHTLPLFPDMGGTATNSFVCPMCYRDAVFTKPNEGLKRG